MENFPIPRIDLDPELGKMLLPYCRFRPGDIYTDTIYGHRIGCVDASDYNSVKRLLENRKSVIAIHDPPYNFIAFKKHKVEEFISWCRTWIEVTNKSLQENASLYIWLGADQNNHFQPLADFILMMRDSPFSSRSFITLRNQRGFGTQKNWMSVRQELLFYIKGKPYFDAKAGYTDIPKILKGYYKNVNGKLTDNIERSKSQFLRAGNVWVDIQQVFYRMEENVNGCYAQKPLKAIQRLLLSGSRKGESVIDFFAHSGTTLLAAEVTGRRCFTADIDPVFCEITLRRLEHYRATGKTGWQNSNPFAEEILSDKKILNYLNEFYSPVLKELLKKAN